MIGSGHAADRLPPPFGEVAGIAAEMSALHAEGVGPKRAEVLLARLKAGREFRAIPGGGETTDTLRAVLRLVGAR
jgi:hypothetical protein